MKKSIRIIFFFNSLLIYNYSISQSCDTIPYQHVYYNEDYHESRLRNFSFASNNDIYLVGYLNKENKNINGDVWIMRTTFHGTPLWSKAIGTPADETISSIKNIENNGYAFSGTTRYNSKSDVGWIAKVDSLGIPLWSLELNSTNGSLYKIEELNNGDFVAAGILYLKFKSKDNGDVASIEKSSNFIIRIDCNGNVKWQRAFHHYNKEELKRVQQLSDGNLIATGDVIDTSLAYILKIDQYTGNIIWMNQFAKPENSNYAEIQENNDKSIEYKTGNRVYEFSSDGKFKDDSYEIELTANNKKINNGQLRDVGSDGQNEIYYANIKPDPILFSVNSNNIVKWAHIYTFNSSAIVSLASTKIFNRNIYLSGLYEGDKISDTAFHDQLAYLLKTTLKGEALCFDTANISFKIINIPFIPNTNYNWINEGTVTPQFISLYSKNILPKILLACSRQTCCNDVMITKNDIICENGSYTLPDGSIVTQPGFYTTRINTLTGCDSIVYTNLIAAKKIQLSLTADTCIINGMPVTFNLPLDSSVHYRWQDGNTSDNYTVNFPGKYWVTAVSNCYTVKDSVNVFGNCEPDVFMPSAFTPNNDGLNDIFRIPQINDQHLLSFDIYNRFGQLIFHSENNSEGWDGTINNKPQPAGTYIYIIKYSDLVGKLHLLKGTVVVIR